MNPLSVLGLVGLVLATDIPDVVPSAVPDYVLKYAPVVHLYSEERYFPLSVEEHVRHFRLQREQADGSMQDVADGPLDTVELGRLGSLENQTALYMTALEDFDDDPDWITGNLDHLDLETGRFYGAPSTLIVVEKPEGVVDAFWFYFYPFNLGPYVMGGGPYGNHVGDWEHSAVRFHNGKPVQLYCSAHSGGTGYRFEALEKLEHDPNRPVIYSARGTHANYVSPGDHERNLPSHMLLDYTDRGALWDPAKNFLAYFYDGTNITFGQGSVPGREQRLGHWLHYLGHWGDNQLPTNDPRQQFHPFQWRYVEGPTGPLDKNLMRRTICEHPHRYAAGDGCRIRHQLDMGEGGEAEGMGGCARLLDGVRPVFLRYVLQTLTWGGLWCTIVDQIWG